MSYWSNKIHNEWIQHYFESNYNGSYFLGFTKEWQDEFLPKSFNTTRNLKELVCNLIDKQSGIVYKTFVSLAYEHYEQEQHIWNIGENGTSLEMSIKYNSLMPYFYEDHYCPCNRHHDAIRAGLAENEDDVLCEGDRFNIVSLTPKDTPNLILLSETMSLEELEEHLKNG